MQESASEGKFELNGSFTQFEQAIRNELHDLLTARGLRDLIPGYIEDWSLKDRTLSLIVLSKPEDPNKVNIKLTQVPLTISTDKSGTASIPKQTASLMVSDFQVVSSVMVANAEQFARNLPVYKVCEFIDYFASPKVVPMSMTM